MITMWTHPPQGAIWHIYNPSDAPKIRALLAKVSLVIYVTMVTADIISGMWGELPWLPSASRHWSNTWSMLLLNHWFKEEVTRGIWSTRLYDSSVCWRCHLYSSWCPPSGLSVCLYVCSYIYVYLWVILSHDPYWYRFVTFAVVLRLQRILCHLR